MNSPYYNNNGGVSFMPPPGLSEMLAQRDKQLQEDGKSIGRFAGSLAGGIGGAIGGAAKPEIFGAGTSAASGAGQGFLMNFNAGYNGGGGGGGGMTGFAGLKPGAAGGGGMNLKQFAAAGKAADGLYDFLASKTPSVGDSEPNVYGVTPEQWKHLGTQDKLMWADSVQEKQANQLAAAKIADFAAQAQQRQQQERADAQVGLFMAEYARLTSAPEGEPLNMVELNPPRAVAPGAAFAAAANKYPLAPGSSQFDNTLQRYGQMGGKVGDQVAFTEDPETGSRFATYGHNLMPSGVNIKRAQENLPNVPGYTGVPGGRGRVEWLKNLEATKDITPAQKLASIDKELASFKDLITYPEMGTEEDRKTIAALRAAKARLMNSGPSGGAKSRYTIIEE